MQEPITIRDRNRYFRGTDESILITPIHIGVNISDENTTTAISWNGVTSQRESYTWKSKNTRFYTDDRLWTVSYRLCSDLCFVTYLPPVITSTTELGLATAHEADQQPSLICGRSANWPEVLYKLTCVDKIIVTRAPQRCLIPDLLHIQRLAMPISLHTLPNWDRILIVYSLCPASPRLIVNCWLLIIPNAWAGLLLYATCKEYAQMINVCKNPNEICVHLNENCLYSNDYDSYPI